MSPRLQSPRRDKRLVRRYAVRGPSLTHRERKSSGSDESSHDFTRPRVVVRGVWSRGLMKEHAR